MLYGHWCYIGAGKLDTKAFGFLYLVENKLNGRKYVGIKQFRFSKNRASDWENYVSSSKWLQRDIKTLGKDNFKFFIIGVYPDKQSLKYAELAYMVNSNALFRDDYYNQYVYARFINRKV